MEFLLAHQAKMAAEREADNERFKAEIAVSRRAEAAIDQALLRLAETIRSWGSKHEKRFEEWEKRFKEAEKRMDRLDAQAAETRQELDLVVRAIARLTKNVDAMMRRNGGQHNRH